MRHANSRTTLEVYSQARIRAKREAQQRLVEMIMPDDTKIMMQRMAPDECLGDTLELQSPTCGRKGSIGSFLDQQQPRRVCGFSEYAEKNW
jgi:hypothetical protein